MLLYFTLPPFKVFAILQFIPECKDFAICNLSGLQHSLQLSPLYSSLPHPSSLKSLPLTFHFCSFLLLAPCMFLVIILKWPMAILLHERQYMSSCFAAVCHSVTSAVLHSSNKGKPLVIAQSQTLFSLWTSLPSALKKGVTSRLAFFFL